MDIKFHAFKSSRPPPIKNVWSQIINSFRNGFDPISGNLGRPGLGLEVATDIIQLTYSGITHIGAVYGFGKVQESAAAHWRQQMAAFSRMVFAVLIYDRSALNLA